MSFWRQLKWRIVGAHMVVVIVGVAVILLMAGVITGQVVPANVRASVSTLVSASDSEVKTELTDALLTAFRRSILTAVSVAALGAIVAGIGSGLLLAREILRPLRHIARSSRRIARGHYGERVAVPASDELAMVATNFNQMAESLEHVEDQRITLIGNVSHELRTPLTGLEGYLEGLMDGLFPPNEETFAHMYQEARRLRRLVDDLQVLSRVEAGQISLRLEAFELLPLIERLTKQLDSQAIAQRLELRIIPPQKSASVYADPDRSAQVILNLIGNAIQYAPEGGSITVEVETTHQIAQIIVRDTGIGISADALPFLFERFYRVDASRNRQRGGSGIGLTISRHLAWMMGGELTAASEGPGQGSTFTFTLPLARP